MSSKQIIAVCGATGTQGSSVVAHLLRDDFFAVRALVRNKDSASASKLRYDGAEIVQVDFDDMESLKVGFSGAYGVYALTDFFEAGPDRESQQGINMVDAAKSCDIRHFIWSTVEASEGSKYDVDQYLRKSGIPRTSLFLTLYLSNIFLSFRKSLASNTIHGPTYDLNIPFPSDSAMPSISSEDIGAWVATAFLQPEEWIDKDMKPCSENLTPRQYAAVYEEMTGVSVNVISLSRDEFMAKESSGGLTPDQWTKMKWFLELGEQIQRADMTYTIYPGASNWRKYLTEHLDAKPTPPLHIPVQIDVTVSSDDH